MWLPGWVREWMIGETVRLREDLRHAVDGAREAQQENVRLTARNGELERRVVSLETSIDWMRARVNQVEAERAVLLSEKTKLPFGAPIIRQQSAHERQVEDQLQQMAQEIGVSFEDIGDEAAAKQGIDHDDFGLVINR